VNESRSMILTARRQQRMLAEIRRALRRSDPRLVARFGTFTRLAQDEEMPRAERIRSWPPRSAVFAFGRRPRAIARRLAAIVVIPAVAAVLISVPFIVSRGRAAMNCTRVAVARAQARPRALSPPVWTVPSCRPGGLSRAPARSGLPMAPGSGLRAFIR
jgi:hypothetical protein